MALLIDPVFEQARRDVALIEELGLKLRWTLAAAGPRESAPWVAELRAADPQQREHLRLRPRGQQDQQRDDENHDEPGDADLRHAPSVALTRRGMNRRCRKSAFSTSGLGRVPR